MAGGDASPKLDLNEAQPSRTVQSQVISEKTRQKYPDRVANKIGIGVLQVKV
jgi:hypothetical protein